MSNKYAAKTPMTDEHKAALARGRVEGRVVREYLEGLRATKPKRGRKRTVESVSARIRTIEELLPAASPLDELLLVQERSDLQVELARMAERIDIEALENRFVDVARDYSASKKIAYQSWRDVGVTPAVLKRAGIRRGE